MLIIQHIGAEPLLSGFLLYLAVFMLTVTLGIFRSSWCDASERGRGLLLCLLFFAFCAVVPFFWCALALLWAFLFVKERREMAEWNRHWRIERWRAGNGQDPPLGGISLSEPQGALSLPEGGNLSLPTPNGRASHF